MMNHTKEPWVAKKTLQGRNSSISNRRGKTIAIAYQNENIDGDDLANAKRIVACVNACAGITNEALEAGVIQSALINFEESHPLEILGPKLIEEKEELIINVFSAPGLNKKILLCAIKIPGTCPRAKNFGLKSGLPFAGWHSFKIFACAISVSASNTNVIFKLRV